MTERTDPMYRGFYINLDRAVERRQLLERNLEEVGLAGKYSRFAAVDGATITYGVDAVPGSATIGCLLSHLLIVKEELGTPFHLHIVEDDVIVHREIGRVFETFATMTPSADWDLLMTDIFLPPDVYLFKYLNGLFKEAATDGTVQFLDISAWDFAGASSYFLNGASKEKFLSIVEHGFDPYTPIDIRIRALARKGLLKVFTCFPFFSTIGAASKRSTIAGDFSDVHPLLDYRRAFYVEPELEKVLCDLMKGEEFELDLQMQIYLALVKRLLDPKHKAF